MPYTIRYDFPRQSCAQLIPTLWLTMHPEKQQWLRDVPRSRMVYPRSVPDQCKYWFWRIYGPFHPFVRNTSRRLGIGKFLIKQVGPEIQHTGRQDFLLGVLHPKYSVQEFVSFLVSQGFGNHFIAWKDAGELVSLRRTLDFKYQYHLRIFADGEVRCHYEYTPECHPVLHFIRVGFEDRSDEFKMLLKDWVVPPHDSY